MLAQQTVNVELVCNLCNPLRRSVCIYIAAKSKPASPITIKNLSNTRSTNYYDTGASKQLSSLGLHSLRHLIRQELLQLGRVLVVDRTLRVVSPTVIEDKMSIIYKRSQGTILICLQLVLHRA